MDKAPLPTLITLPVFGILKSLGLVKPENGSYYGKAIYITGAVVCGIIPFIIILFLAAESFVIKKKQELILMSFVAFFSSFLFVFAGTFFAHILAAMFILLAYLKYEKSNYLYSGLFCGLAFLTEYTTLWIIFSWLLIEVIKNKSIKNGVAMALGFSPALLFIFSYNYYFTGNPFTMLYLFVADNFVVAEKSTYGLSFPKLKALYGLLFSENRGLLFYAPVLLYGLYNYFTNPLNASFSKLKKYLMHPVILPFLLTLLFISSHASWDGGWTYGPRHLISVSTLLLFSTISSNEFGKNKWVFYITCGYGFICTMLAKLTVIYSVPELEQNILSYLISKSKEGLNDGNILSLLTHQNALFGFIIFIMLFLGSVLFRPKIKSY